MSAEIWIPVRGYEGRYEVSDHGRVRTLITRGLALTKDKSGLLSIDHSSSRYARVGLTLGSKKTTRTIHSIVMESFVGTCPEGMQVRHLNGNTADNTLKNLVYGTPSENQRDTVAYGGNPCSNRTHCPHGHPYSDDNTYITPKGARQCRACKQRRNVMTVERRKRERRENR